jgi:ureidoacrylate peracid hydrolase
MFQVTFPSGRKVVPALIVVDMQNGSISKGGSYDKLGMNTSNYREIIPKLKDLIEFCRSYEIPIFYTEAVKEASGIDVLTKIHNFLPKSRQERLKFPICIRGTWSGFRLKVINLLFFTGIDTSICVETSLRDGFNIGYGVVLISDATASGNPEHYKTTLERVRDYYGLVMNIERFKRAILSLDKIRKGQIDLQSVSEETVKSILDDMQMARFLDERIDI